MTRRATTPAALLAFPGFFQAQPVVVRGTLTTRDQAVLLSPTADRSIPVIFNGPSPPDGPVELRGNFWDLGRLQREDPRILTLGLDRLVKNNGDESWPRPGDVVALVVTDAMSVTPTDAQPNLRLIALDPSKYVGQRVKITGQFRGRNLYGEVPQTPGISKWDFVLHAADAGIWVTGVRPRGKDFNLDINKRVDAGRWLEATGVVREGHGLVWIEAQQLVSATPDVETRNAETLPAQLMGPPPEVIFSDPEPDETGVPLKTVVRLQFSRDMNPETFKGHVFWHYAGAASAVPMSTGVTYDGSKRSLEIRLTTDASSKFEEVFIQLDEGIAATDGAKLAPWKMSFMFAGQ
jgi:hypothetical protein